MLKVINAVLLIRLNALDLFFSNKSISNRKKFARHLREAAEVSEFDSLQFLRAIHNIVSQMHSPCLRLELLQYILGLDNRYSGKDIIPSFSHDHCYLEFV